MQLSKNTINGIEPLVNIQLPHSSSFELPEKVIQFGTGVLLRGLPDYFIDQANKKQLFNGRVVMVKSTTQGNIHGLREQDNLYTLCVRGLDNGAVVEDYFLNNAVSRILTASEQWDKVLDCASDENIQVVISNTTEVGIQLTDDGIHAAPPESFPGKLLAFLHARYQAFDGDKDKGLVVIPTELLVDNGDKLKEILIKLAQKNKLSEHFMQWLQQYNAFCNSLVDRIVPGKPDEEEKRKLEAQLGYEDQYLIKTEPYRLWAIETGDEWVNEVLSFSAADKGVILARDISKYRRLKLRLLNGTHTFSCALAYLSGFETVREAMEDEDVAAFIGNLMEEIAHDITDESVSLEEARSFAKEVSDRFRNPYMVHQWLSISVQYSSKMKMRNVPLLTAHYNKKGVPPKTMAAGLAAYLLFMRSEKRADGSFWGTRQGKAYPITDDKAAVLYEWWKKYPSNPVSAVLSDARLWEQDLTALPGLADEVEKHVLQWMQEDRVQPPAH